MMNKKLLSGTTLAIALVLFVAFNIAVNQLFKSARLDLTDHGLYTLSEGSRNILRGLEEPITLRFFLSEKLVSGLPSVNTYAIRVKELLEEYQRVAGDKLNLLMIDPEPFSEAEDQAVGHGLQGVPLDTANTTLYFGLAGSNSVGDEEVIGFFQPSREEFLEYDITKLIYQLANPKQPVVGIMSSLPIMGERPAMPFMQQGGQDAWMVVDQLRQLFEVREIDTEVEAIPEDVDVLLVVHPKNLGDGTRYAIDQYVLAGGRAVIFVDPHSEADQPPSTPNNPLAGLNMPRNSELDKLFAAWGVELTPDKVVADMNAARRVQTRKGGRTVVLDYPVWLELGENNLSSEEVITAKLGNLSLATAGALRHKEGAKTEFAPLVFSSKQAMLVDTAKVGMMADPESLLKDFQPADESFILAARITGEVETAFPEGKPVDEDQESEEGDAGTEEDTAHEHLKVSKAPINLIVVADTDLLQDRFWVQVQNFLGSRLAIPHAANGTFVSNAADNLTGSNDLISVRNRGGFSRPFTRVEEIRQRAEREFREKEQQLQTRLQETEQKLRELQTQEKGGGSLILSPEQQQALERFREEKVRIRKELREVQHALQKDIEALESRVKFINIGLLPLLIGLGGIALGVYRVRRRHGEGQS